MARDESIEHSEGTESPVNPLEGDSHACYESSLTREKKISTPGRILPDGTAIEECWNGVDAYFYVMLGTSPPSIERCSERHDPTTHATLIPFTDDMLTKGFILLSSMPLEYEDEVALFRWVKSFVHTWAEIDLESENLLSLYVMLTYLYDKCPSMPIVNLRGPSGAGKSRLLEVMRHVAYRGTRLSGCTSYASLFRISEMWKGTACINEGDYKDTSENAEIIKFLNERVERHGGIQRINKDSMKTEVFAVFGPTVMTTRRVCTDDALERRCLTIEMREKTRSDIPLNLPKEFYDKASELRNMLLMFRFRNIGVFENDYSIEFEGVGPRTNQVLQPLASLALAISPEFLDLVRSIAKDLQRKTIEAAAESPDGLIARAFLQLEVEGEEEITASYISRRIEEMGGKLSPIAVGKRSCSLGLVTTRSSDGKKRLYTLKDDRRKTLIRNFVPLDERTEELVQGTFSDGSDKSDRYRTQEERVKGILCLVNTSGLRYEEFVKAHPELKEELDALMKRGVVGTNPIDGGLCSLTGGSK